MYFLHRNVTLGFWIEEEEEEEKEEEEEENF